jgi:hypothetical protein
MARREHFGPQLEMFVPAGAFEAAARADRLVLGDLYDGDIGSLVNEKVQESEVGPPGGTHGRRALPGKTTLYKSIKKHGVKEPVIISHEDDLVPELGDGHHRAFTAADIDPKTEVGLVHGGWYRGEFYDHDYPRGKK